MDLVAERVEIAGIPTRLLRGGGGELLPVLFVHGGVPGVTPYCSGSHIWGAVLSAFAQERPVIAVDLPGSGETALPSGELPTVEGAGAHLLATLRRRLGVDRCHLVGHDQGGLIALWAALEQPDIISAVSIVASAVAAPTGDIVENVTLAHPPVPLWGRHSQAWALDRISYKHDHIDRALIDACVGAATVQSYELLHQAMAEGGYYGTYMKSVGRTKSRFYESCRGPGFPVPVQVVWASHDPLSEPARGLALFRDIVPRQPSVVFDLINRSGSLIFRDQPQEFFRSVSAFQNALERIP